VSDVDNTGALGTVRPRCAKSDAARDDDGGPGGTLRQVARVLSLATLPSERPEWLGKPLLRMIEPMLKLLSSSEMTAENVAAVKRVCDAVVVYIDTDLVYRRACVGLDRGIAELLLGWPELGVVLTAARTTDDSQATDDSAEVDD
jgi:hypothetical protein